MLRLANFSRPSPARILATPSVWLGIRRCGLLVCLLFVLHGVGNVVNGGPWWVGHTGSGIGDRGWSPVSGLELGFRLLQLESLAGTGRGIEVARGEKRSVKLRTRDGHDAVGVIVPAFGTC